MCCLGCLLGRLLFGAVQFFCFFGVDFECDDNMKILSKIYVKIYREIYRCTTSMMELIKVVSLQAVVYTKTKSLKFVDKTGGGLKPKVLRYHYHLHIYSNPSMQN